jgi:hypothetical protein
MTTKRYSMDYWVDPQAKRDPDRTDYSDDRAALEEAAPRRFDGQPFARRQLYRRKGNRRGEMENWEVLPTD